jgi:hypothetical protein
MPYKSKKKQAEYLRKYRTPYMREYRKTKKEQMDSLRKAHPGIYETFFGKPTGSQKKKTQRKTKK